MPIEFARGGPPAAARAEMPTPAAGTCEPFIVQFLRGAGRAGDFFADSWPAAVMPILAELPANEEGPERAPG